MNLILSLINLLRIGLIFAVFGLQGKISGRFRVARMFNICGPSFVKLGQLLSTRPDLVGGAIAKDLKKLQDKMAPFSSKRAIKILEKEIGQPWDKIFKEFDPKPIAAASIAQVHKALTFSNEEVAVKIMRPYIGRRIKRDLKTLQLISWVITLFSRYQGEQIKMLIGILEGSLKRELDFRFEAAAAAQIRENLANDSGFEVIQILWNFTTKRILVTKWVHAIAISDLEALKEAKIDAKLVAKNLIIGYFNQVYRDGFFHADMHPGNLLVRENGDVVALDFGISASIAKKYRLAIAQIFMGFLHKDYKKVAQIHIDAGLVPEDTNLEDFTLACRIIGEPIIGKSLKEISLAKLLTRLVEISQQFKFTTKPELLLLQKAMTLLEGVGVSLDENLNIWEVAQPWLEDWARKNIGFDAKIRDNVVDMMKLSKKFPQAAQDLLSSISNPSSKS